MKKLSKVILVFILSVVASSASSGQESVADVVKKINMSYQSANNMEMVMEYRIVSDQPTGNIPKFSKGVFKKKGQKTYSEHLGIEKISNGKYDIILDSENNSIILSDAKKKVGNGYSLVDIQSLLKLCSKSELKTSKNGAGVIIMKFEDQMFTQYNGVEIHYNKKSHLIKRMVLHFNTPSDKNSGVASENESYLEIIYSDISKEAKISDSYFQESKYVKRENGKWRCVEKYKDYRLINMTKG